MRLRVRGYSDVGDGRNVAYGSYKRPSPTRGIAAISIPQTLFGTTSDWSICFTESNIHSRKPLAGASLKSSVSRLERRNVRVHPYPAMPRADRRRPDSSRDFPSEIETLLENHSASLYSQRQDVKRPVNSQVLIAVLRPSTNPVFTEYTFVRSTRVTVQKFLGETNVVDDLVDVELTASDIKNFDKKKRLAEEVCFL